MLCQFSIDGVAAEPGQSRSAGRIQPRIFHILLCGICLRQRPADDRQFLIFDIRCFGEGHRKNLQWCPQKIADILLEYAVQRIVPAGKPTSGLPHAFSMKPSPSRFSSELSTYSDIIVLIQSFRPSSSMLSPPSLLPYDFI